MADQIKLAVAVIALALALAAGWFVRSWYDDSREAVILAAQKETRDKMLELAGDIATANEVAISKIRITNRDIYHDTVRETSNNPAYDCPLPPVGVSLLNAARSGNRPATGEPGAAVRPDADH